MSPSRLETSTDKGNTRRRRSADSADADSSESQGLIQSLRDEIESIKRPSGTQTNPARTCKDLYMCNGKLQDGEFRDWPVNGREGIYSVDYSLRNNQVDNRTVFDAA